MSRAPSFAGVVLSAGASSRMGRDKALLPWRGSTFLESAIGLLNDFSDMVIVVAGQNAQQLAPLVYARGGFLVVNPNPDVGQFSSLRVGLQEVLNRGRDAAIVTLVDRPPASPATVRALLEHFASVGHQGKWAVVPEFEGKHGHPIVAGRELMEAFLRAPDTAVARDIEHQHQERIEYLPVTDPLVTMNVDTPADYEKLMEGTGIAGGRR